MGNAAYSLFMLFVVAATVLTLLAIFQRYRKQRPYSTALNNVSIEEVWNDWISSSEITPEEASQRDSLAQQIDAATLEAVKQDLVQLEHTSFSDKYPLTAIRAELMASVDRRMLNQEILNLPDDVKQHLRAQADDISQTDAQAKRYLAANELRLMVLREYAGKKFGDKVPGDWFAIYEKASLLKQRDARKFLRASMDNAAAPTDDARHQAITLVDQQLRSRLLQVPPGTVFPGFADAPQASDVENN
ncbi:MAG: hypothetical protein MJA83_09110 [Gammaproteobacteria bacterium]|nr:hypothetical protein [Gammaproteobacteria bacterium]